MSPRYSIAITATLFVLGGFFIAHSSNGSSAVAAPWAQLGEVANPALDEISGLAQSQRNHKIYWAHNDSGSGAYLYAFDEQGQDLAKLTLNGIGNRDWEDLASFTWQGKPWLLVGEVGDNEAHHPELRLHLLEEPELQAGVHDYTLEPTRSFHFVYPEGPRDCESIAVDMEREEILILSKRDVPARLYRLPLNADTSTALYTLEFLDTVPQIPQPTMADELRYPKFGRWSSQPTALDLAPDGRSAAVLTYKALYIFPREPGQSWAQALAGTPQQFILPDLAQAESLVYMDATHVLVSSEKRPSPLVVLDLNP